MLDQGNVGPTLVGCFNVRLNVVSDAVCLLECLENILQIQDTILKLLRQLSLAFRQLSSSAKNNYI